MKRRVGILLAGAILLAACRTTEKKQLKSSGDTPPDLVKSQDKRWEVPVPDEDGDDWIRLKSGEWLKGDLDALRDGRLEFDSDELDNLKLDWEDVALVRSPKSLSVLWGDQKVSTGTVLIQDGQVTVRKEDGTTDTFPRGDVVTIVPGGKKVSYWSGTFSFGLTARKGNTDQADVQLRFLARRQTPLNRLIFEYLGNYGELNNVQSINNHLFNARWDRFVSRRYFLTPIAFEYFRDTFQNTEARITPAVGFGYHIFGRQLDKTKFDWDISPVVGYRYTKYFSGAVSSDTTAVTGFTTFFNWDITPKSELTFKYTVAIGIPDTTDTNQHAELILSYDLWNDLDLDITFVWDRVGQPRADSGGNLPQPDDFRMSVGIGWDF